MRTARVICAIFMFTFGSLLYVHQQTRIVSLAYLSGKKQAVLKELLDANNILRYNMNVISSLPYLDKKILSKDLSFEIPREQQLVRFNYARQNLGISQELKKRNTLLSVLFGAGKQAEAKTLNH
ncbi:MAG: hypothetical protein WC478_05985 [Candidatus Omnitrophota bacterium]